MLCNRGLQTTETKVGPIITHPWERKLNGLWVPLSGQPFNDRSARITEPEQFGDLVEGFARRIVTRAADNFVFARARHKEKICVTTRDDQRQGRMLDRGILETN